MSSRAMTAYIEPVLKSIRVQATPARAFEVFTGKMARWWLPTHTINPTKSPIAAIVIEPREGGRWYERGEDGSECDWGRVLVWQPPKRVVLAWQINAHWQYDAGLVTELEVRFTAQPSGATDVTLEHRLLERLGDAAPGIRDAIDSPSGWSGLLERYAAAL
jgi:uncharacterized protein YndB with AHSA1/START domain